MADFIQTLIAKDAVDAGFDIPRQADGGWLAFASTHSPMCIWLTAPPDGGFLLGVSQQNVAQVLGESVSTKAPAGARGVYKAADRATLLRLTRRAFDLSLSLPDELLHAYDKSTADVATTEAVRLAKQRVGQELFRGGLMALWGGRCAVSGLAVPSLLRASHAKPWRDCETDAERLDVFNGLLLAPHLDALFDAGWMTVDADGSVRLHDQLDAGSRVLLAVSEDLHVKGLRPEHLPYLAWHRERVFGAR